MPLEKLICVYQETDGFETHQTANSEIASPLHIFVLIPCSSLLPGDSTQVCSTSAQCTRPLPSDSTQGLLDTCSSRFFQQSIKTRDSTDALDLFFLYTRCSDWVIRQKEQRVQECLLMFMDIYHASIQEVLDRNQVCQWERLVYLPASDTWIMSVIADEQTISACRAIGAETYVQEKYWSVKAWRTILLLWRSSVSRSSSGRRCAITLGLRYAGSSPLPTPASNWSACILCIRRGANRESSPMRRDCRRQDLLEDDFA